MERKLEPRQAQGHAQLKTHKCNTLRITLEQSQCAMRKLACAKQAYELSPVDKKVEGSAEWRKPLESGRVSASVTEGKKTKEKERYTGCQNRRFANYTKT